MVEGGEQTGFLLEAGEALGVAREGFRQDFDGHLAAELGVAGAVDLTHPTGTDFRLNAIVTQCLANHGANRLWGRC